jgi:hypothetical protein
MDELSSIPPIENPQMIFYVGSSMEYGWFLMQKMKL